MGSLELAFLGLIVLLVLLIVRVPVAIAMLAVGITGYITLSGIDPLLAYMKTAAFWQFASYDFTVIPMFLLMGEFAARSGLSRSLFAATNVFLGHRRGGVAMAAVGGCGAFGAICGSSLATAGTMARVAIPELERYRYSGSLATGALAAGGTLGILIPPSVALIIYAIAVQANIVQMFQAALIPGILGLVGYLVAIFIWVRVSPESGPVGERASSKERIQALIETWPTISLFLIVIGGIYFGIFDPTEGAAVGAFGAGILAYWKGGLDGKSLSSCIKNTAKTTGMIFLILLGAGFLNIFFALTGVAGQLSELAQASSLSPYLILILFLLAYLILGCLMDSLAMIFLTIPIFWPIMSGLDFGMPEADLKMWFGVVTLIVVEAGLITPPVGINVLIINNHAPNVPMRDIFRGVMPFLLTGVVRVGLLILVPPLTLYLPHLLS
ncbi:MAG: C4-dicarboxylate ABC transporter permease [Rhodospirillaceae bacterium]|nr:C4-dicarboxylate ABC transporter permease [Rhodospirillaceae bacterium]|tara:strand:+ start:12659 stop:13978 length:1320 start_codon:yes stop_codon:yes gene_type:complete